jgi:hypothetical protein
MNAVEAVRAGSRAALDEVFRAGGDLDAVDRNGATPLIAAAESGRLDLLKFLLQCGVSLNAQDKSGQTALMVAAGKGDVYSVKHLLTAGANPNLVAILETERLLLRRQTGDDIPALVALWSDPQVTRHLGGPRERTVRPLACHREVDRGAGRPLRPSRKGHRGQP